jgi:predicted TIM-barrel fold metal-dependent hydrolase
MEAYNRWLVAEWLEQDSGLWGALMVAPQNPEASAREIEKYAGNSQIKAIYLPTAGVNPLWGHRKYDCVMKAAESSGWPMILHSVTLVSPADVDADVLDDTVLLPPDQIAHVGPSGQQPTSLEPVVVPGGAHLGAADTAQQASLLVHAEDEA